jgi:hypothetical protein
MQGLPKRSLIQHCNLKFIVWSFFSYMIQRFETLVLKWLWNFMYFWTFSYRQLVFMCMGIQTHPWTMFLVLQFNKLGNFWWLDVHGYLHILTTLTFCFIAKMTSSFFIPWMCVVTSSVALKHYPTLSFVAIDEWFGWFIVQWYTWIYWSC